MVLQSTTTPYGSCALMAVDVAVGLAMELCLIIASALGAVAQGFAGALSQMSLNCGIVNPYNSKAELCST